MKTKSAKEIEELILSKRPTLKISLKQTEIHGKIIYQIYKYKPFINLRCGGCNIILVRLHKSTVAYLPSYPIAHCGKLRI